ncbi:hypothetical protein F442_14743, partial [Phytophthora nicotianae P10297]
IFAHSYGKQKERRFYPNQSRKGCQAIPSRCSAFIQASLSTRLPMYPSVML